MLLHFDVLRETFLAFLYNDRRRGKPVRKTFFAYVKKKKKKNPRSSKGVEKSFVVSSTILHHWQRYYGKLIKDMIIFCCYSTHFLVGMRKFFFFLFFGILIWLELLKSRQKGFRPYKLVESFRNNAAVDQYFEDPKEEHGESLHESITCWFKGFIWKFIGNVDIKKNKGSSAERQEERNDGCSGSKIESTEFYLLFSRRSFFLRKTFRTCGKN